ncbi:MAG TPA: DUF3098 domain-containing protein [Cytophagales bacterium]|jgi:uncharacterized membrane protein HdeD (DUF308 family)|nr:DUF3098 domain-containing protein [Cytophagales bacterium]
MDNKDKLAFQKGNYLLLLAGIALLIIGFFLMTQDKEDYGFGTLGITIGPIFVMLGFIVEIFAIFYKGKKKE